MKSIIPQFVSIDNDRLSELVVNVEGTSEECCGFLLGHDHGMRVVTTVIPASNMAADRRTKFQIDPLEYLRAERYAANHQLELVGIYHSHPNTAAIPSETDLREAQPCFSYVILSVSNGRFADIRSWRLNHLHHFEEETVIH